MFIWRNYPWTNFNELNLDWIMRILKEVQTEAIPALDEKIDNVYEYIRENLPEIIASITSAVIDVKAAGATGDGTTDDSDAIHNALAMGDILYFPEGNYRFRDIEVNKPVYIIGNHATLTPIHKHPNTNQSHCMFKFYDHTYIQGIIFSHDNSVVSQSGTKYITEAAVQVYGSECVIFNDCHIRDFFELYRDSVSSVLFEDRQGMFLYTRDCENVTFYNCEFNDFGGQELIWMSQQRGRYADGFITIDSCQFLDRNSGDAGSALNVLGGTLAFSRNQGRNYNNVYTGGTDGGSIFNFLCPYVNITDNVFTNCYCGNFFDLSEGYYNKVDFALVANNIFEGNCKQGIRALAKELYVRGNTFEGEKMVHTFTCNSTPSSGIPYHVSDATLYEFDVMEITDNTFVCKKNPFNIVPTTNEMPIFLGQTQDASGSRAVTKQVDIRNNNFMRDSDAISFCCIYFYGPIKAAHIVNNVFVGAGESYPLISGRRALVSGAEIAELLDISYNVFDMSEYTDGLLTYVVTGGLSFRTNSVINEYFNIAFGSNVTSDYQASSITEQYNINIS